MTSRWRTCLYFLYLTCACMSCVGLAAIQVDWVSTLPTPPCPNREQFEEQLAAQLGQTLNQTSQTLQVHVGLTRTGNRIEATLEVRDNKQNVVGRRALSGRLSECSAISAALAEAFATLFRQVERQSVVKNNTNVLITKSQPISPPLERAAPQRGWSVSANLLAFSLPPIGFGASVGHRWVVDHLFLRLELSGLFGMGGPYAAGAVLSMVPRLVGCVGYTATRWGACLELSAGAYVARGLGYATNRTAALPWLSVGPRFEFVPLPNSSTVRLMATLNLALLRPRWELDGSVLWTSPLVGIGFGAVWDFVQPLAAAR